MRLDRALHDGETEAAATGFRREERIEEAIANLDRNASTRVTHSQRDGTGIEGDADRKRIEGAGGDVDVHDAAVRRRLDGVEHEIEHGAVEQVVVTVDNERHALGNPADDANVLALGARVGEGGGVTADVAHVHGPRARDAYAREVQKLGEQPRQPIRLTDDETRER